MQYEVVNGPVNIPANWDLTLNAKQIAARAHSVQEGKGGKVTTLRPIQFKTGEVIGIDKPMDTMLGAVAERLQPHRKTKARKAKPAESGKTALAAAPQAQNSPDEPAPESSAPLLDGQPAEPETAA